MVFFFVFFGKRVRDNFSLVFGDFCLVVVWGCDILVWGQAARFLSLFFFSLFLGWVGMRKNRSRRDEVGGGKDKKM